MGSICDAIQACEYEKKEEREKVLKSIVEVRGRGGETMYVCTSEST